MHRWEHEVRILWAYHSVHHSSSEFDLALTKEVLGTTTPRAGEDVTFEITVRNEGFLASRNFTVTDHIVDGFIFDGSKNPDWTLTPSQAEWQE